MASLVPPSSPGCCWRFSGLKSTFWNALNHFLRLTNQECLLRYLFSFTKVLLWLLFSFFQNVFLNSRLTVLAFQQRSTRAVTKDFLCLKKEILFTVSNSRTISLLSDVFSLSFIVYRDCGFCLVILKLNFNGYPKVSPAVRTVKSQLCDIPTFWDFVVHHTTSRENYCY